MDFFIYVKMELVVCHCLVKYFFLFAYLKKRKNENMFATLPDAQVENSAVKGARSHMGMHSPWGSSNANHR